ncbi:SDR family oxidoreductase [Bacillus sp. JNUCC-24]|nr:SDR family oxidoreductase [Bacillus safensis]PNU25239.1 SDR family oxidoreductase [Bacillus stratosphericus]QWS50318.1 SDR family oxidoreductase [Bacillus sp. JNUCC-24]
MWMSLSKRIAFVTGASTGIGKAIAIKLAAQDNVKVIINSRNQSSLEDAQQHIGRMAETKEPVALFCGDMSDEGVRAEAFTKIEKEFGRLDVLINNIPGGKPDTFDSCDSEQMMAAFSQKAIAYIDTMKRAAAMMKRHEYGRIIQIVGNLWKEPGDQMFTNSMMNAAIINASKNAATQLAPSGITVNCLNPGFIATDRYEQFIGNMMRKQALSREEAVQAVASGIPMKRVGSAYEMASLAAFIASEEASYLTGQQISVDGGSMKSI